MTAPGDYHARAVQAWTDLVAKVPDDAWDLPTPCAEWTVRDLVNHLTYEELWTVPLFRGATIAEVGDRFDGYVLGDDPKATSRAAATAAAQVVDDLLPGGGTVHMSWGKDSMTEYAAQLAADHLVHHWDLAAAIGADRTLDPELVAVIGPWFAVPGNGYPVAGAFADPLPPTGDPQGDLLAAFGRDRDWSA